MMRSAARRNVSKKDNGSTTELKPRSEKRKRAITNLSTKVKKMEEKTTDAEEQEVILKKPRTTERYTRGKPILFHCNTSMDRLCKLFEHLRIGSVRRYNSCEFASLRLFFEKNQPSTSHILLFELPPSPILFLPQENVNYNSHHFRTTVRLEGEKGEQFQQLYNVLLEKTAATLAMNKKLWKALKIPSPSKDELIEKNVGTLFPDRFSSHYLLSFRIPSTKTFLLRDERRTSSMQDEAEADEFSSCLPSSLKIYQLLEGTLRVNDLWLKVEKDSDEGYFQWGISLTAKTLTVKDAPFEMEELTVPDDPITDEDPFFDKVI
jgi:hypothetical protein